MRAYFFGNMYLSSIQQGIQAAHVTHELFTKYMTGEQEEGGPAEYLWEWATNHKTMILLNGGYAEALEDLHAFFESPTNPYPYAWFHEEKASLNGALTSVGIVLPERIYSTAYLLRHDTADLYSRIRTIGCYFAPPDKDGRVEEVEISRWDLELCQELNRYGLAS